MTQTTVTTSTQSPSEAQAVMIDLETLGVGPNGAVIQIGAQAFNYQSGAVGEGIQIDVEAYSSIMLGGEVHGDTVQWWRNRGGCQFGDGPRLEIKEALKKLSVYFSRYSKAENVWAKGPSFDIAILEGYYMRAGLPCPWKYYATRDVRTIFELARSYGWEKDRVEVAHNGLADAQQQIKDLIAAFATLPGDGELRALRDAQMLAAQLGYESLTEFLTAVKQREIRR